MHSFNTCTQVAWPNGKALLSGLIGTWQRLWVRVPSPSFLLFFEVLVDKLRVRGKFWGGLEGFEKG
jgi:hypothetical protein